MLPYAHRLDPDVKAELVLHAASIDRILVPIEGKALRIEIGALMTILKSKAIDDSDTRFKLALYEADLRDLPSFALKAACASYRRSDDPFLPTPGEIRATALKHVEALQETRFKIRALISAKVSDPPVSAEVSTARAETLKGIVGRLKDSLRAARPANEIARGFDPPGSVTTDPRSPEERLATPVVLSEETRNLYVRKSIENAELLASEVPLWGGKVGEGDDH